MGPTVVGAVQVQQGTGEMREVYSAVKCLSAVYSLPFTVYHITVVELFIIHAANIKKEFFG